MSIDHYENFPVASVLCPPELRPAVHALYRFARTADDIADEGDAPAAKRKSVLGDYAAELRCAAAGTATSRWPDVFVPLGEAIERHALPVRLLHDLIDAFVQDCANLTYDDRAQLLDYCSRSANPIGRLLLHLYDVHDDASLANSDAICTALQLTNFWQDPSVDLPRGRNYFPSSDLRRHGIRPDEIRAGIDSPATQAMLADLVDWTESLMIQGQALVHRLPGRSGWELRLVVQGGLRILERIRRMRYRTLASRPTLHGGDWWIMLWRALRMAPAAPLARRAGA